VLLRNQESFRLLMSSKPNDEECPSTRSHDIRRGKQDKLQQKYHPSTSLRTVLQPG
jgi:hypothetical protein